MLSLLHVAPAATTQKKIRQPFPDTGILHATCTLFLPWVAAPSCRTLHLNKALNASEHFQGVTVLLTTGAVAASAWNRTRRGHTKIFNCTIEKNTAAVSGGGVYLTYASLLRDLNDYYNHEKPALEVTCSRLIDNHAKGASGGGHVLQFYCINIMNTSTQKAWRHDAE